MWKEKEEQGCLTRKKHGDLCSHFLLTLLGLFICLYEPYKGKDFSTFYF